MVKLRITTLVIMFISFKSEAIQFPEDTVAQPNFILRATEAITKKCHLSDSASERFYNILKETRLLYGKCRRDSTTYIQTCRDIIKKMENEILQKFGKIIYDEYYHIAYPGPCFPKLNPYSKKKGRKRIV